MKKHGVKKYDRVLTRIGRAQENDPSIHRFYQIDEQTTWEYYNLIREIEATFHCLKTDLDLCPMYH